jgi:hypothetical protein
MIEPQIRTDSAPPWNPPEVPFVDKADSFAWKEKRGPEAAVGFGLALDAILGEPFRFGQLRIVGEFGGCASQQI